MSARTRRVLASAAVVLGAAAVVVWLGQLLVEAEIRNAYETRQVIAP